MVSSRLSLCGHDGLRVRCGGSVGRHGVSAVAGDPRRWGQVRVMSEDLLFLHSLCQFTQDQFHADARPLDHRFTEHGFWIYAYSIMIHLSRSPAEK